MSTTDARSQTRLTVSDYRVLFDRQDQGFPASAATCAYRPGTLSMAFLEASDGRKGLGTMLTESPDLGRTWSEPAPLGPPLSDPATQFQAVNLAGATREGTLLACGTFLARGIREDGEGSDDEVAWRPSEALVGRREIGGAGGDFGWTRFPSGTFMGEQFVAPGVVTKPGRIVLSIWGAAAPGENWGCGVLLSDDDGRTWRFRRVGLVADHGIRQRPGMPAGFNEQTLIERLDGTLVSIIRGRERLGAATADLSETFFFHSESRDGGETWTAPEVTNLAGTGAGFNGIALPDGSLLMAARVPHLDARACVTAPCAPHYGLHLARSLDGGRTWSTERLVQATPAGAPFDYYYNAMNGCFVQLEEARWMYVFGHFDYLRNRHHVLSLEIARAG